MINKPVKALLLSAGLGTRLRPLTLKTPKCLLKVGNKTILERWIKTLEKLGCESAIINTHYLSNKVEEFIKENHKNWQIDLEIKYEKKLLGTAGTLIRNKNYFKDATCLMLHTDNATKVNLKPMLEFHKKRNKDSIITMLTFKTDHPESCGIVNIDEYGIINSFEEKVKNPKGNIANGAIYLFDNELFDNLNQYESMPIDFSTEVIPKLIGRIQTWHTDEKFIDIGTPETYNSAQDIWQ